MVTATKPSTAEKWMRKGDAAKKFKVSRYTLNRIIEHCSIGTKQSGYDKRAQLVNVDQLEKMLKTIFSQ